MMATVAILAIFAGLGIYTCSKAYPELVRVDTPAVRKFLSFLGLVFLYRLIFFGFIGNSTLPDSSLFEYYVLFFVFWEDMLFTFPSLLMDRLGKSKLSIYSVIAISSVVFASAHTYQGVEFAILTLLYVPAGFYYGKKFGLGTVMVAHVLYDLSTYGTILLMEKIL